nr:immunoglobulin heavy chain junction region [Macaca mulatta]MOV42373.1 immunoglobulin heavy chain junction region [Macaca mulatta]MOV44921.1 immunoglobulin heavy chain junction region [Macaca mulatta]MOV44990.1 immunoglobulin heavy chain junction region [Macaca mulatta]MOV46523.1 immunoglobulin heavy chain junction region [Macaca mulatta]
CARTLNSGWYGYFDSW